MLSFDRKPGASAAPAPVSKPVSQRPATAPPPGPLWARLATSSHRAGQTLPASLRSRVETAQGVDFSRVRVHRDASDVTTPLHARAVTRGQDIYFHPGEFQPNTAAGEALIAHELAHTRQTRQSEETDRQSAPFVSRPGDALEQNAAALARGATAHAFAAPAGAALCSPFDAESATDRARRESLIQSISNAINVILHLLSSGGLLERVEVAVERGGVRGVLINAAQATATSDEEFTSYADRDARLRRIVRSLMAMAKLYRSAPIPAEFAAPVKEQIDVEGQPDSSAPEHYVSSVSYPGGTSSYGGKTPEWADLQGAYERYRRRQGQTGAEFDADWYLLIPPTESCPAPRVVPAALPRASLPALTWSFQNLDHEPLRYWHLDGKAPTPKGSRIVEFWHDDFGYYYEHKGQRIDVPSPWSY